MLFDKWRQQVPFNPYINTGTMLDYLTGKFRPGIGDTWLLDGGLPPCMGLTGRGQTYKSGEAGSFMARAMVIHPQSQGFVYESENTIPGPERYDDFVDEPVSDRITFMNTSTGNLSDFSEVVHDTCEEKEKHKKDYIVECPFIDPKTLKPYKIWIPTFMLVDSFSRARSDKGDKQYEDNSIDESGMNTFWLSEGNVKTRLMNDLPGRAAKYGIYVILTAHVGNKQDLDPYNKSPKQLQYMKNTDKMKNVGSNFEFLTTALLQTIKAEVLQTKEKTCEYPASFSTDVEVNGVSNMMVRCKNNASGIQFQFVVSQYQGILDAVTNFHFLRSNKYWGLNVEGNKQNFATPLYPEVTFNRRNIREKTNDDYKTRRGLELIAQLCFVQTLWSTWKMPPYVNMNPMKMGELLNSDKAYADRVLNSTGVWSTSKQDRERMTLMDVLAYLYQQEHPQASLGVSA